MDIHLGLAGTILAARRIEVVLPSQGRFFSQDMPRSTRYHSMPDMPAYLDRWFCSKYVASLCEVARVAEGEARKLEKESKNRRKARTGNSNGDSAVAGARVDSGMGKAARLLRVLITGFNAFLRHCRRGQIYSKT